MSSIAWAVLRNFLRGLMALVYGALRFRGNWNRVIVVFLAFFRLNSRGDVERAISICGVYC